MIGTLETIWGALNNKDRKNFIGSVSAKIEGLHGVPRIIIPKNKKPQAKEIIFLFNQEKDFYSKIDSRFFPIIKEEEAKDFFDQKDFIVVFDSVRVDFTKPDSLYSFVPPDLRDKLNINARQIEQTRFLQSNGEHLQKGHFISTQVIQEKLCEIWRSKWDNNTSYVWDYDLKIIDTL